MQVENEATKLPLEQLKLLSVIQHLRDPQNLVTYLVFTAWCKFMGISSYIPAITIG
jgi:hypothetical protein